MDTFLYVLVGLIIGIFSSFFGIGGGLILTPVLLLMKFPPATAIATSLLFTIGTTLSGAIAHFRHKQIDLKLALILGCSGIIATQLTYPFVKNIDRIGYSEIVLPLMFILILICFTIFLIKEEPTGLTTSKIDLVPLSIKRVGIGFLGGVMSTSLGVGGGFVLVPLLVRVFKLTIKQAIGTSLFSVFMIVFVGFMSYIAGQTVIDYSISLFLLIGAILGGQLGGVFLGAFSDEEVRKMLGLLYGMIGLSLLLKLLSFDQIGFFLLSSFCICLLYTLIWRYLKLKHYTSKV